MYIYRERERARWGDREGEPAREREMCVCASIYYPLEPLVVGEMHLTGMAQVYM